MGRLEGAGWKEQDQKKSDMTKSLELNDAQWTLVKSGSLSSFKTRGKPSHGF